MVCESKFCHRAVFLISLAMMSMSALIATDIFIPALPYMISEVGMTSMQAQSLISVFLFGIALMQLIYGPLSDGFGRKPLLLWGVGLFTIFSLLLAFAVNYHQLVVLRFLQAVGACVGLTLGRALVADLYSKEEAGKVFLTIFPFVGMSPAIAPVIGGFLNIHFGWRACFLFTAVFSGILFLLILFFLKESKPKEKRTSLHFVHIIKNYGLILKSPGFLSYTLVVCFAYGAYFSYISESPFLLLQQGLSAETIGTSYISLSVMYVLGNLCARRVFKKLGLDRTIFTGYCIFLMGGALFFLSLATLPDVFALSIAAISLVAFGNGFLLPLGTAGGVTANPALSGVASGVLGCFQLAASAASAQLIGILSNHEPFKVGMLVFLICFLGFSLYAKRIWSLKASAGILKKQLKNS